jgi:hypothetical protein
MFYLYQKLLRRYMYKSTQRRRVITICFNRSYCFNFPNDTMSSAIPFNETPPPSTMVIPMTPPLVQLFPTTSKKSMIISAPLPEPFNPTSQHWHSTTSFALPTLVLTSMVCPTAKPQPFSSPGLSSGAITGTTLRRVLLMVVSVARLVYAIRLKDKRKRRFGSLGVLPPSDLNA